MARGSHVGWSLDAVQRLLETVKNVFNDFTVRIARSGENQICLAGDPLLELAQSSALS